MPASSSVFASGVLCCALLAAAASALAGEFSVNPIRLELGAAVRSGAIAVKNEGQQPLSFQLQVMEWRQDPQGKDQYLETRDLIFFPKILTIEPGQQAVVRVGTRAPVVPVEKTYRLFIEELPGNAKAAEIRNGQINFLIRFGVPVFITPSKTQDGLEIADLALVDGSLNVAARNTGNRHQVVQGIHLKGADTSGKEVYALTLADRYFLAGTMKSYTASIPADQCAKLARIEIEFRTDKLSANRKVDVDRAMCAPR